MKESKNSAAVKKEVKNNTALSVIPDKNISDRILSRVMQLESEGGIHFPENYSYPNALRSAWLILQQAVDKDKKPVLESCTKESIANALLDMVIQGLSPAKKQCYFIPYGKTLSLMRSYMGTIAVTKRLKGVKDVFANVIYAEDTFTYKIDPLTGLKEITEHVQEFANINSSKIVGAYAVIIREDLPPFIEIMNYAQITAAWSQGIAYSSGKSKTHSNFADEMAKKTVINRACKLFFNTSNDSDLLIEAIHRTTENEYSNLEYEEEIQKEIDENANKQLLDINPDKNKNEAGKQEDKAEDGELFETVKDGPRF